MECRHDEAASRFEAVEDGHVVGWVEYRRRPSAMAMTHTIVPEEFSGRGIGTAVVAYALERAIKNGWAVLPYCPFIRSYISNHPEYINLVPESRRTDFSL